MAKQLIELADGILVEVSADYEPEEVTANQQLQEGQRTGLKEVNRLDKNAAIARAEHGYQKVDFNFKEKIKEKILEITESLGDAWVTVNKKAQVTSASVELGFGFEKKGNIFIAEASANASIKVTINWDFEKIK